MEAIVPYLFAGLVFAGVVMVFLGIRSTLMSHDEVEERLDTVLGRRSGGEEKAASGGGRGVSLADTALGGALEKTLAKRTFAQQVQQDLARADLKLTVTEFMAMRAGAAFIGFIVGYIAGVFNSLISVPIVFAFVGAIIGYKAPSIYVGMRQSSRLRAFNQQLPDTITLLANGLRSGNSMPQAMELASREAPSPTNLEFGRVVAEISLGLSPEEALNNLVRRIPSADLDLMVTSMNINREVGGNLAQVLDSIGNTIRERMRIKGDIDTKTAQVQGSAYIISALPVLIGLVIFLLNGKFMKPMFQFPYIIMYVCAGIMIFVGFMIMKKMVEIKV